MSEHTEEAQAPETAAPQQLVEVPIEITAQQVGDSVLTLIVVCHGLAKQAGWWKDLRDGTDYAAEIRAGTRFGKALVAEKLALVHSEVSEALEGHRKDLQDQHLPDRKSLEVELADAIIRICDLAGAMDIDLPGALVEKLQYNAQREDHRPENRLQEGGKAY